MLFPVLAERPERPVLTVGDTTLTAAELASACAAIVDLLRAANIKMGERVGVWTQGDIRTPVALAACALAGVVTVPLNPRLGTRETAHIAADAAPGLCLAAQPEDIADSPLPPPLQLPAPGQSIKTPLPQRRVDDDPLIILYTSGTTGLPKGAVLSARAVAGNLDALARVWRWTAADTVVHALPLFHAHGLVLGWYGSLRVGGRLHWQPRFEPAALAAALHERAVLFAVPTMYTRLADLAGDDPAIVAGLRRARLLISGSAGLPLREHQRLRAACGRDVYERYGLSETLMNCAVPIDGPPQPGRVGPPLPGVELRLVDDQRSTIPSGDASQIGEIAVRGPNLFSEYLNNPAATAAVRDADGWFYTGDLADRDAAGSIRIVGRRATDLIKSGGFKIGAGEIEAALVEHPSVREAAVVGLPDPDLGETIVAYIVPADPAAPPTLEQLAAHVSAALSPHKRPRHLHIVEALPRNAMGKVLKAELRARPLA